MNDIVDLRKFLVHWTNLSDLQRKDVSHQNKIRIGWCAFLFVLFHTVTIIVYAFPTGYIPRSLQSASAHYVQPVFEQTWSLFAPAPILNSDLKIKYYFGSDSTGWVDPMQTAEEKHAALRVTHHAELALGESNLLHFISLDLNYLGISLYDDFPQDSTNAFQSTSAWWSAGKFIYGTAEMQYQKRPDSALMHCYYHNVKTDEKGSLILPKFIWKNKSEQRHE